ncbi:hypothetical protein HNY73_017134 [Argiope bruennichi]|uniref:Uncharacterized protein n=1 Tax=Argiope bruennichi TaxID=94029 RepID=A0A8T0EKU3_ARGBR|nr:hypothetical protein HNY73_017134 [Argiope bruennichi]
MPRGAESRRATQKQDAAKQNMARSAPEWRKRWSLEAYGEGRLVASTMWTGHIFVASRSDLAMSGDFVVLLS